MLKWIDDYYIGETVRNVEDIRQKLEQGKLVQGIYLLTLSENPHNILEIIPAVTLFQKTAVRICPEIIGVARGIDEAMELVRSVVQTVYDETGDVQVEEYLKNR